MLILVISFFLLFGPLVIIFGHMVFIYSVIRFRSDVPISKRVIKNQKKIHHFLNQVFLLSPVIHVPYAPGRSQGGW